MRRYVRDLEEIDPSQAAIVGGKAAGLGELGRTDGINVPAGFCVTADAFDRAVASAPSVGDLIERLSGVAADHRQAIRAGSAELREAIERIEIPAEVRTEIAQALTRCGETAAYAVRSSATTEDLAAASAAGQHDSFLNVLGVAAITEHVRSCWASLFTDRAVAYRLRNGVGHHEARMAVIVQQMAVARAAGVLFTADPVTGNRRVAAVEAAAGLGEALVAGLANPDAYTVRGGEITDRIRRQETPVLTDEQVLRLVELGRRIEAGAGRPQDIEWCLGDDGFQIVQSRPITTLFPIPASSDIDDHVYVSVGHQQMMTDALKPLGLSMWQMLALIPMHEAGSRLFVDVTPRLTSPAMRATTLGTLGRSDPLLGDALQRILDRPGFIRSLPDDDSTPPRDGHPRASPPPPIETDPAIPAGLIERSAAAIEALKRDIAATSGVGLLDFIRENIRELQRYLRNPLNVAAIMAGMEATWWLNDHLDEWLGERNAADTLSQSAPGNVTSEMGLALLDVADVIRARPAVIAFLERSLDDAFLDTLPACDGGDEARAAIQAFVDRYGMRCIGEIDITRPRWSERPAALVPLILSNVRNFSAGEAERQFYRGRREAEAREQELLTRLQGLPDGDAKAEEAERMIDRLRTFIGYREYPKYAIVARYLVYKQAVLGEADRLVHAGLLAEREDVFFLRFDELYGVVGGERPDPKLIHERRSAFRAHQTLTPPRVLTSDGEVIAGAYRRDDVPAGALAGLAVSGGTVEGRARVILDVDKAELGPGDILVTAYTDPSWALLFVAIAGLVTEVGGQMTHGAVIAREYGLPAVVGVERATELIADGQRIRVHGTSGYVEILTWPRDVPKRD